MVMLDVMFTPGVWGVSKLKIERVEDVCAGQGTHRPAHACVFKAAQRGVSARERAASGMSQGRWRRRAVGCFVA
jgi:hypothetical protein